MTSRLGTAFGACHTFLTGPLDVRSNDIDKQPILWGQTTLLSAQDTQPWSAPNCPKKAAERIPLW